MTVLVHTLITVLVHTLMTVLVHTLMTACTHINNSAGIHINDSAQTLTQQQDHHWRNRFFCTAAKFSPRAGRCIATSCLEVILMLWEKSTYREVYVHWKWSYELRNTSRMELEHHQFSLLQMNNFSSNNTSNIPEFWQIEHLWCSPPRPQPWVLQ